MTQTYPKHVAIIPDGCRRWAKQHNKPPWEGHAQGIQRFIEIGKWSLKNTPIQNYTLYALSAENLDRPPAQLKALEILYTKQFMNLIEDEDIIEGKVNLDITGRLDLLPPKLQEAVLLARDSTSKYKKKFMRIALGYSGRMEIVDAVQKLKREKKEITMESISKSLYSPDLPEPDLIIRTAEKRVSNFLLWQGAYAELYFVDKYWPSFGVEDYQLALKDYSERQRRFGK